MLLRCVAARGHCGACGEQFALTGRTVRDQVRCWADAHWLPHVDEVEMADPATGRTVTTFRRRTAA